jgi:hypothetical protein
MFWALLAHLQEAQQHNNWYIVIVLSVGYYQDSISSTPILVATNRHNTYTNSCVAAPPEDKQVMLKTCRDS